MQLTILLHVVIGVVVSAPRCYLQENKSKETNENANLTDSITYKLPAESHCRVTYSNKHSPPYLMEIRAI